MAKKLTAKSKKQKAKSKKPAAPITLPYLAENIDLTFTIGEKLFILKPKEGKLESRICMETVLRLALDKHIAVEVHDAEIHDLEEKIEEITKE